MGLFNARTYTHILLHGENLGGKANVGATRKSDRALRYGWPQERVRERTLEAIAGCQQTHLRNNVLSPEFRMRWILPTVQTRDEIHFIAPRE